MLRHPRLAGVFDELWVGRIPDAWIYSDGDAESLLSAMRAAGNAAARAHLKAHPIKASWADATDELLSQYQTIIKSNLPNREVLPSPTCPAPTY